MEMIHRIFKSVDGERTETYSSVGNTYAIHEEYKLNNNEVKTDTFISKEEYEERMEMLAEFIKRGFYLEYERKWNGSEYVETAIAPSEDFLYPHGFIATPPTECKTEDVKSTLCDKLKKLSWGRIVLYLSILSFHAMMWAILIKEVIL